MRFLSEVTYNKEIIKDKIHACWIGKNIGGTIGGPYEWSTEFLDVKGFSSPKGEPLPNDDLDLQLAWLFALERYGVRSFDANKLAATWIDMIIPNWNEYGVCKRNLKYGLLPPLSGEYKNDKWKNSNGAWIRSELWACLAPGYPNVAIKYAIMDAVIDHGMGEGLYAEIFTAALQSIAFFESDVRKIVETALGFIPENTRVFKCVRLVLDEYDKKTPYSEVRNMLIEQTKDLGAFQAPANLGYVAIGLIYGEGDFKNSVLYAVNCGDDTDCTAGTVGAIMGIIGGTKEIPEDWLEYIGDKIVQKCVHTEFINAIPKTCTEFTDRIMHLQPVLLNENGVKVGYSDTSVYNQKDGFTLNEKENKEYFSRSRFSFDISDHYNFSATVNYEKEPTVKPFEEFKIKINLRNLGFDAELNSCKVDIITPKGFSADYERCFTIARHCDLYSTKEQNISGEIQNEYCFTVTAGEDVEAQNKIYVILNNDRLVTPFVIPITLLG